MQELFAKEEQEAKAAQQRGQQERASLLLAVQDSMRTRQGRALLRWLLSVGEVFSADYGEAGYVLFQQGKRHAGMRIMRLIQEQHPENIAKLLSKEAEYDGHGKPDRSHD